MALTEKKKLSDQRHHEKLDRISIQPYKEEGAAIRAAAAAAGESVQGYILKAVRTRMENEKRKDIKKMKAIVKLYRTNAEVRISKYDHCEDESQWQEEYELPRFSVYFEDLGYDLDNLRDYLAEQLEGVDNAESLIDDIVFRIDSDYWHREEEDDE